MPVQPAAPAVGSPGTGLQQGLDGFVALPAQQFVAQRLHTGVAPRRVHRHGACGDGVQRRVRSSRLPAPGAPLGRQLGTRRPRQPIGSPTGQQLVEQHAQRVYVHGRAGRGALQLLGRRAVGAEGQQFAAGLAEQTGDAEVQQAQMPLSRDQQIGRLEVAMHHQALVRVGHRIEHLHEEAQALRQRLPRRPAIKRLPLHALQRQPGLLAVHPGVVQARDVRVLQAGEQVALARKALGQARTRARQLERDAAVQTLQALGAPDLRHAALAQQALEAVGADVLPGLALRQRLQRQLAQHQARVLRGSVGVEQALQGLQHRRLDTVQPAQPGGPLARRQVQCLVKAARHLGPEGGGNAGGVGVHGAAYAGARQNRSAQLHQQGGSGLLPLAPHGALGQAQGLGSLDLGEAAEEAQLHQFSQAGVELRQPLQGLVQALHL
jgi:hypothetical protein